MIRILATPNYRFLERRYLWITISTIVILTGVVSFVVKGGLRYSIDFTGGTLIELRFSQPVDLGRVREWIQTAGLTDFEVSKFGEESEVILRTQDIGVEKGEVEAFIPRLQQAAQDVSFEVMRTESVGPKIGSELKDKAYLVVLYSLIALLIYITWRFEFKYAVAAIIALVHDVLVTLGAFSLTDREISLAIVAAVLTIIGYSLNDTIVIFDRVRENLQLHRKMPLIQILNKSVNETLSRTIITGGLALVVVVVLFIFGGEVIKDFAFAFIVGMISGVYSTVYIASPIVLEWENRLRKKEA